MKIKKDYVLRQVAGTNVVLPVGEASLKFNGMLSLNETASLLWSMLERDTTKDIMVRELIVEYDVTAEDAEQDVSEFIEMLAKIGCLDI